MMVVMLSTTHHLRLINAINSDTSLDTKDAANLRGVVDALYAGIDSTTRDRIRLALRALGPAPGAPCGYTVSTTVGGIRLMDDTLSIEDALGLAVTILSAIEVSS